MMKEQKLIVWRTAVLVVVCGLLLAGCGSTPSGTSLTSAADGAEDAESFNPDVSTGSDRTLVRFLDKPFTDSFTAEVKAHAYIVEVPEDVPAVDIYTTGTANHMTILTRAGVMALTRGDQPDRKDVLGTNYNNKSLGLRATVSVPPDRTIYIWIQNVDKLGKYTVITKSCQTVYPSPFEGAWRSSTYPNTEISISGNTISFFVNQLLGGKGSFTYTDDDKMTVTLTHGLSEKANSLVALPGMSDIDKEDKGLKYQVNCRIAGNELNAGPFSFLLADTLQQLTLDSSKWTRK
jgi:hypothetical protein